MIGDARHCRENTKTGQNESHIAQTCTYKQHILATKTAFMYLALELAAAAAIGIACPHRLATLSCIVSSVNSRANNWVAKAPPKRLTKD